MQIANSISLTNLAFPVALPCVFQSVGLCHWRCQDKTENLLYLTMLSFRSSDWLTFLTQVILLHSLIHK